MKTIHPHADISFDNLPITRKHLRLKLTWMLPITPMTVIQDIQDMHDTAFERADDISEKYGGVLLTSQKERCQGVTITFCQEDTSVTMKAAEGVLAFEAIVILKFDEPVMMKDRVPARNYLKTVTSRLTETM